MAIDGINTQSAMIATQSNKDGNVTGKASSVLDINSFFKLLAAQLSNQDMTNPVQDSEFMAQLSQFTTIQAIQNMTTMMQDQNDMNLTTYAISMVGKEARVAALDDTGNVTTKSGIITGVSLYGGSPTVYINNEPYALSQIMTVGNTPDPKTPDPTPEEPEEPETPEEPEKEPVG